MVSSICSHLCTLIFSCNKQPTLSEREKLKGKSEDLESKQILLVKEKTQLSNQVSELQRELDTLKKDNLNKCNEFKQLESKLQDLQESRK